jgi:coenzyme Q-binding protein COQ10
MWHPIPNSCRGTPPPASVHAIDTEYLDGPFKYMKSTWGFTDVPGGCEVDFFVDFEFRNAILQGIIGLVFNDAMLRIVRAFERRAAELYGPATI